MFITFNNTLYHKTIECIENLYETSLGSKRLGELKNAYSDVAQGIPEWKETNCGYTEIRLIKKDNKKDNFKSYAIEQLMDTLEQLLEVEKLQPGNITILLRYKNVMPDIVEAFNKKFPQIKIVSDEAYKMAFTDAQSNAAKQIGLGADIWFEKDVTKYTKDSQEEQYAQPKQVAPTPTPQTLDELGKTLKTALEEVAKSKTVTELQSVWNKYALLQKNESFKKEVTSKKKSL